MQSIKSLCSAWRGKYKKYCIIKDIHGIYWPLERHKRRDARQVLFDTRLDKSVEKFEKIVYVTNSLKEAFLRARRLNNAEGKENI